MNLIRGVVIAFSMYSKIPVPLVKWEKESMKYSLCFFPLVGGVIGLVFFLWGKLGAGLPIGSVFYTTLFTLIPVFITGGIHLDGYLDTVDALSSYQSKERKLEILKDSNSGAFAIIWGIVYFILIFGIYSEIEKKALPVIALGFVLSRILSGYAVADFTCAKNSGLASAFSKASDGKRVRIVLVVQLCILIIIMIKIQPISALLVLCGSLITFIWYRHLAYKEFGGITGDLAGFFLQVCELVIGLLAIIGEKL
ncbi:MAG: adenosylcobinamide-GDP ribazoletransferase [Lachnospiraceae bacterium]